MVIIVKVYATGFRIIINFCVAHFVTGKIEISESQHFTAFVISVKFICSSME